MPEEILFSRFKIIREIGKGGFGTVLQAFDLRMERSVAIKKIPKEAHTAPRAVREAKTIALLSHPNIVTLYDFLESEHHFYLVMEQVKGFNFKEILAGNDLDWEEAVAATLQVSHALESAHFNYVIHRDIKPSNLILTADGRVKVLDFGIARLFGNSPISYKEGIIGTLAYISPEQAADDVVDERSDLFSLGVFCYEALTGLNPFSAETQKAVLFKIQNHVPKNPCELNPDIPEGVGNVVMKMLEKNPDDRFNTMVEMRYKMLRYAGNIEEQELLRVLHFNSSDGPSAQEASSKPKIDFSGLDIGIINNIGSAILLFALILYTGQFVSQGAIPDWAFGLALPVAGLSVKWPRIGVLIFFLILTSINTGYNIVLGAVCLIFLLAYGYLSRNRPTLAVLTPFTMPILANAGYGLSFPLLTGLLLGPVNAFIAGLLGSIITNLNDLFSNNVINFTTIGSSKLWNMTLDTGSLISQIFTLFFGNWLLILQAILIGAAGLLIASARGLIRRLSSLLALAVLILILYGYHVITSIASTNPAADYNAALKAWFSSLFLSVPILLIWGLINYFNYQKEVRTISNGITKRIRK